MTGSCINGIPMVETCIVFIEIGTVITGDVVQAVEATNKPLGTLGVSSCELFSDGTVISLSLSNISLVVSLPVL